MKIALIAPVEETVPPQKYGGTEWIIYAIAHGMGKKGHEVDLYAAKDSREEDGYNLIPVAKQSLRSDLKFANNMRLRETGKFMSIADTIELIQKRKYDIIHNHASWRFLIFADLLSPTPIVTTHHIPLSFDYQAIVFTKHKDLPSISISNNQRKDLPHLNFVGTVYNAIDLKHYPVIGDEAKHKYPNMFFLARMCAEKGAIEAASVALQLKKKLIVAAKVDETDKPYFANFKPLIDNKLVMFVGELDYKRKLEYLQTARCLLVPIKWEEPFGLMFIEAMACGTPVITFARGSVPEIIKDGETGFIVNYSDDDIRGNFLVKKTGIKGLYEAAEKIYAMPEEQYKQMRRNCRAHVEKHFTFERMVDEYENAYTKILAHS